METTSSAQFPPGTVTIEDLTRNKLILQPRPSDDPEQPLNWSGARKTINFALVTAYSLMTFVVLDIGTVVWGPMNTQLGISYTIMDYGFAINCAGLALGCIVLVPLAIICGRRPVYLVSTLGQIAGTVWSARTFTAGDLIGSNVVTGVAGAISESIVQMTVVDLFFVHQRARMNAIYILAVNTGSFLAPVAAGYCADSQGWRWIWWWTVIIFGIVFFLMLFGYEETKYTPRVPSLQASSAEQSDVEEVQSKEVSATKGVSSTTANPGTSDTSEHGDYPRKSIRERYSLLTLTPGGSRPFLGLVWDFAALLQYPAVVYTALMWGSCLTFFSVLLTTLSTYMTLPPYNFTTSGIGLMSLPPFIGGLLALFVSASNDWIILKLAERNGGVFEPEMRLWLALIGVVITPAGLLLFGLSMAEGKPWIIPCIGSALYGFGFSIIGDASLTYLQDCYAEVIGDALVAVTFVRNALATMVVFALTPWINSMGLYDMFICAACIAWAMYGLTIPMLIWGRTWRVQTAARYRRHILRSGIHAPI
ncbi:hypothetical protein LTR85_009299 [Meristemomyces frigidus]|nr:hypothetical protein LTR85_009299 [Meristemomyces frigidus]